MAAKKKYEDHSEETCIKNAGVICLDGDCENCGWNPVVEKSRKRKLSKKNLKAISVNLCMRKDCPLSTYERRCTITKDRCIDVPTVSCKNIRTAYYAGVS